MHMKDFILSRTNIDQIVSLLTIMLIIPNMHMKDFILSRINVDQIVSLLTITFVISNMHMKGFILSRTNVDQIESLLVYLLSHNNNMLPCIAEINIYIFVSVCLFCFLFLYLHQIVPYLKNIIFSTVDYTTGEAYNISITENTQF